MYNKISKVNFSELAKLLVFSFCFCEIYMWSKNSHLFEISQFVYSFCFIVIIAFIVLVINKFILQRFENLYYKWILLLFYAALVGICYSTFLFKNIIYPNHHIALYSIAILTLIFAYCNFIKFINVFVTLLIVFSSVQLMYNIHLDLKSQEDLKKTELFYKEKIEFKKKPNIYLFWLESYHSFEAQKKLYNINTEDFENFLQTNKFKTFDILSNTYHTLYSFVDVCTLGEINPYKYERGNADTVPNIRHIIGGNDKNLVYKILKSNNYFTAFLLDNDNDYYREWTYKLFLNRKGENLDFTSISDKYLEQKGIYYKLLPILYFTKYDKMLSEFHIKSNYKGSLIHQIKTFHKEIASIKQPYFVTFRGGVYHTKHGGFAWENSKDSPERMQWIKEYSHTIESSNTINKEVIEHIIKKDPQSIIILLGDHGAHSIKQVFSPEDLKSKLQLSTYTAEDYILDNFGVILSIRLPGGDDFDISYGHKISHLNLFRHIFAYLSSNEEIIKNRKANNSSLPGEIYLVKDDQYLY